jgi:hypothetical protein
VKRKLYNIIYAACLVIITGLFLLFPDLSDGVQMLLGTAAILLTSIFTYSNREVLRKRHNNKHS